MLYKQQISLFHVSINNCMLIVLSFHIIDSPRYCFVFFDVFSRVEDFLLVENRVGERHRNANV